MPSAAAARQSAAELRRSTDPAPIQSNAVPHANGTAHTFIPRRSCTRRSWPGGVRRSSKIQNPKSKMAGERGPHRAAPYDPPFTSPIPAVTAKRIACSIVMSMGWTAVRGTIVVNPPIW